MKKWKTGTLACILGCAISWVSCESDSEADFGNLSEIQVNRERIAANQPIVLTCEVNLGENIVDTRIVWERDGYDLNDPSTYPPSIPNENGVISWKTMFKTPGEYTVSLNMWQRGNDGTEKNICKECKLNILPADVRNSFWGDDIATCAADVRFMHPTSEINASDDRLLYALMDNQIRTDIMYIFGTKGLQEVFSYIDMGQYASMKPEKLLQSFAMKLNTAQREEKLGNFTYSYQPVDGQNMTQRETELAELYKNGAIEQRNEETQKVGDFDKKEGVLGKAVMDGKVSLMAYASTATSKVTYMLYVSDGKLLYAYTFAAKE